MTSSQETYLRILREAYNVGADQYDERLGDLQFPKYEALLEGTRNVVSGREPLLDLGCGTGLLLEFLKSRGLSPAKLVGVDLAARMLARARRRGVVPVAADITRLPFPEASFSAATCITVLRIFPVPEAPVLQEVRRVLKPGGTLLLSVLSRTADASLAAELRGSGLEVLRTVSCGQDTGYVCRAG